VIVLLHVPMVLSLLMLGAHFLRQGARVHVLICLALIVVLMIPRRWAAWIVQVSLLLGAALWVHTLILTAGERIAGGEPYVRLTIILVAVAVFTLLSALVPFTQRWRRRYASKAARS
jgi:hypothetical protein